MVLSMAHFDRFSVYMVANPHYKLSQIPSQDTRGSSMAIFPYIGQSFATLFSRRDIRSRMAFPSL
jgi:hypothetical protein